MNLHSASPVKASLHRFVFVSVSDWYYITRVLLICQHLFWKKVKKLLKNCSLSVSSCWRYPVYTWSWGERGVIFLFSAKRPPRKGELSSYLRRAGQRRCFQRICLADFYRGRPSLRSGSRSWQKNHSPSAPSYGLCNRRELVALVTRTSMYLLFITAKNTFHADRA